MTYEQWEKQYPEAAKALGTVLVYQPQSLEADIGKSENFSQQKQRLQIAREGGMAWRNNVGATPVRCPECGHKSQPIRYGLANDSPKLNKVMKSSDLICAIPRVITPNDVGKTIAQFGSIEIKRPGWRYTGKGREAAQAAWLALINKIGGYAKFSTGEIEL